MPRRRRCCSLSVERRESSSLWSVCAPACLQEHDALADCLQPSAGGTTGDDRKAVVRCPSGLRGVLSLRFAGCEALFVRARQHSHSLRHRPLQVTLALQTVRRAWCGASKRLCLVVRNDIESVILPAQHEFSDALLVADSQERVEALLEQHGDCIAVAVLTVCFWGTGEMLALGSVLGLCNRYNVVELLLLLAALYPHH
jgi:hypothetical protein